MKILVVDDHEENRYLQEAMLSGSGHEVLSAANGEEALKRLGAGPVDLVISDIFMPIMDGFALCRKIRNNDAWLNIPFIIYTATYTGPQDEEFARKVGADLFLRKPCEPQDFMQAISKLMRNKGSHPPPQEDEEEEEVLKLYNTRLIRQLEQKMQALEAEAAQRRKAEEELLKSHTALKLALCASNIGLWDWDIPADTVYFSPECKKQLGYEDEEIPNDTSFWRERLHPDDVAEASEKVKSCLEGRSTYYEGEWRLRHKDGTYRWIASRAEFSRDPEGRPRRFTGCHVDITRQREAAEVLEKEKQKFKALTDESPFGVALLAHDGSVLYRNPRFTQLFGYDTKDVPTQEEWFLRAYPDKKAREIARSLCRTARESTGPGSLRSREAQVRCKDGSEKTVFVRTSFMASGEQLVTYEDVTEQKRLENKLRQAQKLEAIGTLAGGIAHDFNNILSAIIGNIELAMMKVKGPHPARAYLGQVRKAGLRARDLVGHILRFSRQGEQVRIPVPIDQIISEALDLLRPTLPSTIEIRASLPPLGMVMADSTQIHQVAMNLCTNAYHAMREAGGVLTLTLERVEVGPDGVSQHLGLAPGAYACLAVEDTGRGMSREVVARVFDPYFTTKKEGEGTGLGLAVVHGIVKSHGGSIAVYSEEGKGTVFRVYFPLARESETEQGTGLAEGLVGGRERVLLVDDEEALATVGMRQLEYLGYRVRIATSGLQALELVKSEPDAFDLVVTDMTMPRMDGLELSREILRVRPDIPIVLCTGFSQAVSEGTAKAAGIREFLMKPVGVKDLAGKVRKALDG